MNNSILFIEAHKLAKQVIKSGDDYRVTFGACLKLIKSKLSKVGIKLSMNYFTADNTKTEIKVNKLYQKGNYVVNSFNEVYCLITNEMIYKSNYDDCVEFVDNITSE